MIHRPRLQSFAFALIGIAVVVPLACGGDDTSGETGSTTSAGGATASSTAASTAVASSTVASTAAAGGAGGMGGAPPDPWAGEEPTVTIADCVDRGMVVVPNAGNEGQLAAARLTPPSYPFQVTGIVYGIVMGDAANGDPCDATLAHRVELYVDSSPIPSNMPTLAAQIDVPANPGVDPNTGLILKQDLPMPITLNTGENLFVAVELAGTAEQHICVLMCAGTGDDDRNYWSNATMPPYNWATLASFGNDGNLRIGANGMP